MTIGLGTGTGSGNVAVSGVITTGAFSLTGDQYSDLTLNNVTASSSITINIGGSGSITASALNTGGALSITKAFGSGETVIQEICLGRSIDYAGCWLGTR